MQRALQKVVVAAAEEERILAPPQQARLGWGQRWGRDGGEAVVAE